MYQIDAFATKVFEGNPAAVIPLEAWLSDDLMQRIAQENNLSETAFFVQDGSSYHLRWFTPTQEVEMCGHATLASAFVLFECLGYAHKSITFLTQSGALKVWREGEYFSMDFPVQPLEPSDMLNEIEAAFGMRPKAVFAAMDYIVVFEDEAQVQRADPDLMRLKELPLRGVCITAASERYDFVTRFFAPKYGIDEDSVTGSAFTQLVSYWADVLGNNTLVAKQISPRGGEVMCTVRGDRVTLRGSAVKYLVGTVEIG